jgi:hypothetical protein
MFVFGGFTGMIMMFRTFKNNMHSSVDLFGTSVLVQNFESLSVCCRRILFDSFWYILF